MADERAQIVQTLYIDAGTAYRASLTCERDMPACYHAGRVAGLMLAISELDLSAGERLRDELDRIETTSQQEGSDR